MAKLKITSFLVAKRKQLTSRRGFGLNDLWHFQKLGPVRSAWLNQNVRTSSHVWMLERQQFVVQLGITEVQWNQSLLGFGTFCQPTEEKNFGLKQPENGFVRGSRTIGCPGTE